jgi:muramoyltetrapeptide carboxypeptidase
MLCAVATALTVTMPPSLVPGDRIAVVAPAGPFPAGELWRGLAWLRTRYALALSPRMFERDGYLAGDDDRRAAELTRALLDDGVKAVVAARGGYGTMRVLERVPWEQLARRPRWLVGFSDLTALHAAAWAVGVASVHAPNVTGLGREASPAVRAAWLRCLERPRAPHRWAGLGVVHAARAGGGGPIVGGNLSLVHAMAAAQRLVVPEGAVLALEDVTEAPYRVDRMLTSLRLAGVLQRASAIVFGGFDRCGPGPDGRSVEEVLAERTRDLGIPVLRGAPFGHAAHNEAFVLGRAARVEGDCLVFD